MFDDEFNESKLASKRSTICMAFHEALQPKRYDNHSEFERRLGNRHMGNVI